MGHSRRARAGVAIVVAAALAAACGGGGGGGSSQAPPVEVMSIGEALQLGVSEGLDAVWLYVDDGSAQPTVTVAGTQDRSTAAAADGATLFKIASISKLFIAVSSTKLVDDGLLRLEDTVAFWLPAAAAGIENADTITVRNLLQHRSGVPDFDSVPGFSWRQPHTSNAALLELVLGRPADFAPDARNEYSNTNYLLLGMILDAALGYSHHDYVQNEILTPLGMVDTFSLLSEINVARLARGYWDNVDRTEQDYVAPGGSMISTVRDTGVFLRQLATGTLLNDAERAVYESLFTSYAHTGWLPGYQSIARYHAATDTVLVQFVNTTGGNSERVSEETYNRVLTFLSN